MMEYHYHAWLGGVLVGAGLTRAEAEEEARSVVSSSSSKVRVRVEEVNRPTRVLPDASVGWCEWCLGDRRQRQ